MLFPRASQYSLILNTHFNYVTESTCDNETSHGDYAIHRYDNCFFPTEKTFKPIVMQQPFIIQSCKGSLEYLHRYGFRTFGEFWDESYDEAEDGVRTYEIGKLLQSINTMSQKEKAQLQTAVNSTVEHNYNWFYGEEFEKLLWNELTTMTNKW